jgi:hypothetical protein
MRSVLVEGSLVLNALQGESPSDFDLLWKVLQSSELRGYITQEDLDRIYVDITRTQGIESATLITYHIKRVLSVYLPDSDLALDVRVTRLASEQSSSPEGMTTLSVSGFLERYTLDLIYRERTTAGRVQHSLAQWFRKSSDLGFDLLVIPLLFTLVLQGLGVASKVWAAPTSEPDSGAAPEATTHSSEITLAQAQGTPTDLHSSPGRSPNAEETGERSQTQAHASTVGNAELSSRVLQDLLTLIQGPTTGVDFHSLRLVGASPDPRTIISATISDESTPPIALSTVDPSALEAKMIFSLESGTAKSISEADKTQSPSVDTSDEPGTDTTKSMGDHDSVEFNVNVEVDGSSVNITVGPSNQDKAKTDGPKSNDLITDEPLNHPTSKTSLEKGDFDKEGVEFVWEIAPESRTVALPDDSAEQVMDSGEQSMDGPIHDHGLSPEPSTSSQPVSHLNSEPQTTGEIEIEIFGADAFGTDTFETDTFETDTFGLQVVVSGEELATGEMLRSQPLTPTTLVATILDIKEKTPLGFELDGSFVGAGNPMAWYQEFIELAQDPLIGLENAAGIGTSFPAQ